MARRRENMLEAFKASRDQALQAQREALEPPAPGVKERLQRSFSRVVFSGDGKSRAGEQPILVPRGSSLRSRTKIKSDAAEAEAPAASDAGDPSHGDRSRQGAGDQTTGHQEAGIQEAGNHKSGIHGVGGSPTSGHAPEVSDHASSASELSEGHVAAETPSAETPGAEPRAEPGEPPATRGYAKSLAARPEPARPLVEYGSSAETLEMLPEPTGMTISPRVLIGYSITLALLSFVLGLQIGEQRGEANGVSTSAANAGLGLQANGADPQRSGPRNPILPDPAVLPTQMGGQQENGAGPTPTGDELTQPPATDADLAFADPHNQYTLVIDEHNADSRGWERAMTHYRYLASEGFPVIRPRLRSQVIYLLVGAGPDEDSLGELLREVGELAYPGSSNRTYSGAYASRIEYY